MGKKDFSKLGTDKNDLNSVTTSYLSEYTLGNVVEPEEPKETEPQPVREKRQYTKLNNRQNKNKTVSLRLTEEQYNELIKKAEENGCNTISNYIIKLLEKGL